MVIFHCYVSSPEGIYIYIYIYCKGLLTISCYPFFCPICWHRQCLNLHWDLITKGVKTTSCRPPMTGNSLYLWWWLGDGLWHCFTHILEYIRHFTIGISSGTCLGSGTFLKLCACSFQIPIMRSILVTHLTWSDPFGCTLSGPKSCRCNHRIDHEKRHQHNSDQQPLARFAFP